MPSDQQPKFLLQRMVQLKKSQQVRQQHRRPARLDTLLLNKDLVVQQMPWRRSWTVLLSPPAGIHTASPGTAAAHQQGYMHGVWGWGCKGGRAGQGEGNKEVEGVCVFSRGGGL